MSSLAGALIPPIPSSQDSKYRPQPEDVDMDQPPAELDPNVDAPAPAQDEEMNDLFGEDNDLNIKHEE